MDWSVGQIPVVADSKPPPPLYFVPQGDERESSVPSELKLLIPDRKLNAPNSNKNQNNKKKKCV